MSGPVVDAHVQASSREFCLTELSVTWLVAGAAGVSGVLWLAILAVI